jgi:translation initiation factor eIF-2B subunit epsilon
MTSFAAKERLIVDEEEVLQAVVLADSFNKRFSPLTAHKPRVRGQPEFVHAS